jgi:hypothetical protein
MTAFKKGGSDLIRSHWSLLPSRCGEGRTQSRMKSLKSQRRVVLVLAVIVSMPLACKSGLPIRASKAEIFCAGLGKVYGLAFDGEGKLFAAGTEGEHGVVWTISPDGLKQIFAELKDAGDVLSEAGLAGHSRTPANLAVDGCGNVWVTSSSHGAGFVVAPDRTATKFYVNRYLSMSVKADVRYPQGVAWDKEQKKLYLITSGPTSAFTIDNKSFITTLTASTAPGVYAEEMINVADSGGRQVRAFENRGVLLEGKGNALLVGPDSVLYFLGEDAPYALNSSGHLDRFGEPFQGQTLWGGAADNQGHIYLSANTSAYDPLRDGEGKGTVWRLDSKGERIAYVEGVKEPMGLAFNNGFLYIANRAEGNILRVPAGKAGTTAREKPVGRFTSMPPTLTRRQDSPESSLFPTGATRESSPLAPDTQVAAPTERPGTQLNGGLLLQRLQPAGKGRHKVAIYELRQGWSEPRKATDPGLATSAVTDEILAVSPNRRYLVFAPHHLLDTQTGRSSLLQTPGITDVDPNYRIYRAAFSPDGRRLAYGLAHPSYGLFVLDLPANQAVLVYRSECAEYLGGRVCEERGNPSWIDSSTLIFAHHKGLAFSYKYGSEDDPSSLNHVSVMTNRGQTILSKASPVNEDYRAVGGTVFRHFKDGMIASAWLDGAALRMGKLQPHEFPGWSDFSGPAVPTVSPDGRRILWIGDSRDNRWRLIDVRRGRETILGTQYVPYLYGHPNTFDEGCLWSPDQTTVACLFQDESEQESLILIPLSEEGNEIIFTEKQHGRHWKLLNWRP